MRVWILAMLAALVAAPAAAGDYKGTIDFEDKPGCEELDTDIVIRTSGTVAEIQLGTENRGLIPIDAASGNFLAKQTDSRLMIAGSVTNGALFNGFRNRKGGCIGRFKTAEQN